MPKISVIMPVYNGEKFLKDALESILNQTFRDIELIIVNDHSNDNTLNIIKNFNDQRIILINNEKNLGVTKSLNIAIRASNGEFIARQDADDMSLPNRLEEQIKYLNNNPQIAMVGTYACVIDDNNYMSNQAIEHPDPMNKLIKHSTFVAGSVLIRKKVLDEIGYFDEFFKYASDYEIALRISRHYPVDNLKDYLYKYRFHFSNITYTKREEQLLYDLFAKKIALNKLDEKDINNIRKTGILTLRAYLTKEDKAYIHNGLAEVYKKNNNKSQARKEYFELLRLYPFNARYYFRLLSTFL